MGSGHQGWRGEAFSSLYVFAKTAWGRKQSRESSRKPECLVEEGKLENGVEAAWKMVGCLVAWGGREGPGQCREGRSRQSPWKAAGEEAVFAGSQNVIISAQFPGQKILVYLNTSASRGCSSPDAIRFAFSAWRFGFPFAAGGYGCCSPGVRGRQPWGHGLGCLCPFPSAGGDAAPLWQCKCWQRN